MEKLGGENGSKMGALMANDVLLMLGVVAFLVLVLGVGIYLGIKSRQRKRHSGSHRSERRSERKAESSAPSAGAASGPAEEGEEESEEVDSHGKRRRVRRRRRDHRPRNPSLAEAGGLPPVRPEDAPPPGTGRIYPPGPRES